jgi:hypothetical protein
MHFTVHFMVVFVLEKLNQIHLYETRMFKDDQSVR